MFKNRSLATVVALGLVVGFAGCDSDDEDTSGPGTGGSGGTVGTGGTPATGGTPGTGGSTAMGGAGGTPATGGTPGTGGTTALKDIVDTAAANPDFSSLVAAVQKAELVTTLKGAGPFTVFAPTNAAFSALLTSLNTNLAGLTKEALTPILTYHVVSGKVQAADVVGLKVAKTVNGADIRIKVDAGKVFLTAGNGSDIQVTMTDIQATNGVIHVINKVMVPPKDIAGVAAANPDFSILVQALTRANLVDAVKAPGPLTVFAPTNAAFAKLLATNTAWKSIDDVPLETLTAVLKYHVVASKAYSETVVTLTKVPTLLGKDVTIAVNAGAVKLNGTTNVTAVDVLASNGVIHVIDNVLLPPN